MISAQTRFRVGREGKPAPAFRTTLHPAVI